MYQLFIDDKLLYDPRNTECSLIEATAEFEINKTNSLVFKISPNHPVYDEIHKLKSKIKLFQDGDFLQEFRVLNMDSDFNNIRTVTCEGDLSYLLDSCQGDHEYNGVSFKQFLEGLISIHNSQVGPEKQFHVGFVTATNSTNRLYLKSNYESSLQTINNKLLDSYGGFIRTRHEGDVRYLDYVADLDENSQIIRFGDNILDLEKNVRGEDVATVLVPIGATDENTGKRVTIESVNNGKDYIEDSDAVNLYGRIVKVVEFDDVTLPQNLLTKAREQLDYLKYPTTTITLNAIDLHLLDVNIERIKAGDDLKVISAPHGIDEIMRVSNLSIDFLNPTNTKIVLGTRIKTFSGETTSNLNVVNTSIINMGNNAVMIEQTYGTQGDKSFSFSRDGLLTCENAVIQGQITAESGAIGGFSIANGSLVGSNMAIYPDSFESVDSNGVIHTNAYAKLDVNGLVNIQNGSIRLSNSGLVVQHTSGDSTVTDFWVIPNDKLRCYMQSEFSEQITSKKNIVLGIQDSDTTQLSFENKYKGTYNGNTYASNGQILCVNSGESGFDPDSSSASAAGNMIIRAPRGRYLKLVSFNQNGTRSTSLQINPNGGGKLNGPWEIGKLKIGNNTYSVTRDSNGFLKAT